MRLLSVLHEARYSLVTASSVACPFDMPGSKKSISPALPAAQQLSSV